MLIWAYLPVQAQNFCSSDTVICDPVESRICLQRQLACGAYDSVIAALWLEDLAPTTEQTYGLGAALYGKFLRERSLGQQCEMVKFSREYLSDYLGQVQLAFRETGGFGDVQQMRQIHHATQMLSELGAVTGCPESGLTRARVIAVAQGEAAEFGEAVFLNPPSTVRDTIDTLTLALRGFVSKASDLETGMALRAIEISSAERHLGIIQDLFVEVFGQVSGSGTSLSVDTAVLDALADENAARRRSVERQERAFSIALNGVSAEEYAGLRTETLRIAQQFLKDSAFHVNMIGVLMPTDPARPFPQLEEALAAPGPSREIADALTQIKGDWRGMGDTTGLCSQPQAEVRLWFCR